MTFINTSEKFGERTTATVSDYIAQLGVFGEAGDVEEREGGIYIDGEMVAEAKS